MEELLSKKNLSDEGFASIVMLAAIEKGQTEEDIVSIADVAENIMAGNTPQHLFYLAEKYRGKGKEGAKIICNLQDKINQLPDEVIREKLASSNFLETISSMNPHTISFADWLGDLEPTSCLAKAIVEFMDSRQLPKKIHAQGCLISRYRRFVKNWIILTKRREEVKRLISELANADFAKDLVTLYASLNESEDK